MTSPAPPPPPNKAPVAVLTGPATVTVNEAFVVDGSASFDPGGKIKSWEYDFLNDVVISGNGVPPPVALQEGYAEEGAHDIVLTVWDSPNKSGAKDATSITVMVQEAVVDPPPPPLVLTVPTGVAVESDSGPRQVTFVVTAEGGQPPITLIVEPPSGSVFQLGKTAVSASAFSFDGQEKHAIFEVEVVDTSVEIDPLTLLLPANITAQSADGKPVAVNYEVTSTGGKTPVVILVEPPSGTLFPVGTHSIAASAESADGQSQIGGFEVRVVSTVPELTLTVPATITLTSPDGNPVPATYQATTTGGIEPVVITYDPPSGSLFPVAASIVKVEAISADGQFVTKSFNVIVNAAGSPATLTLDVPAERKALAPDDKGIPVNISAVTTGGVQPITLTVQESPVPLTLSSLLPVFGGHFPLGATTVKLRATDAAGSIVDRTCEVTVTKQEIEGPTPVSHLDFDARRARPSCIIAYSLRDPVQLAKITNGDKLHTVYDPGVDACRIGLPNRIIKDGVHIGVLKSIPNQVWMPINQVDMGQTIIVADWKPGPLWNYDLGRLDGHKHFNVRKTQDSIWFEPNTIMKPAAPTRLSRVRRYGSIGPPPQTIPGPFKVTNPDGTFEQYDTDAVGPVQQNVYVSGEQWVRYLIVIDQRPDGWAEFSLWVWIQGDPEKLCILDKVLLACGATQRPHHFDFEMNSSSQRARDASAQVQALVPYIWSYGRDVTVHRGEPDPLVLLTEPVR